MKYWLVKTEEDCYPISKLQKDESTLWDGVRNYQARNYLKEMKVGDIVFIYHSNAKIPGITGTATVVESLVPDPLQFKKNSDYYDEKATKEAPRWFAPKLQFKEAFKQKISLESLKTEPFMKDSVLTRKGNRLSVMPITDTEAKNFLRLK